MTHDAIRNLLAAALLAALAGCASQAPFELPDLDTPASASAQATPQGSYPAYRYGYRPYGPYYPYGAYGAYGYSHYGNSNRPRNQGGTSAPGQTPEQAPVPAPAPVPVVPKQVPPRPRNVEHLPQERPARTTKQVDDTRPAPRQLEQ
jgi:predicted small lipoprotein YifL